MESVGLGLLWVEWFLFSGFLTIILALLYRMIFKNNTYYVIAVMITLALCVGSWMGSLLWLGTL